MRVKIVHASLVFLSILLVSCGTTDEDYQNMASDICDCMKNEYAVSCVKDLEAKYEHLYSYETEEDFQRKLIEEMKNTPGCEEYAKKYENSVN